MCECVKRVSVFVSACSVVYVFECMFLYRCLFCVCWCMSVEEMCVRANDNRF